MSNKELIQNKIKSFNYVLGCYNPHIDKLSKKELNKVLESIECEHTDIHITLNRKKYVVEVKTVDNEKDLDILSYDEYIDRYGEPEED
jgi:hypothetical protein